MTEEGLLLRAVCYFLRITTRIPYKTSREVYKRKVKRRRHRGFDDRGPRAHQQQKWAAAFGGKSVTTCSTTKCNRDAVAFVSRSSSPVQWSYSANTIRFGLRADIILQTRNQNWINSIDVFLFRTKGVDSSLDLNNDDCSHKTKGRPT